MYCVRSESACKGSDKFNKRANNNCMQKGTNTNTAAVQAWCLTLAFQCVGKTEMTPHTHTHSAHTQTMREHVQLFGEF